MNHLYFPSGEDGSPIHIIKIKVVQVEGRHLRVSFFVHKKASPSYRNSKSLKINNDCKYIHFTLD
ncbi:hypothetical protein E0M28_27710 [Bacillus toyonensis]|nr:hypothetical protein E0M28_27710 [Bacillus toyonensis]